MNNLSLYIHIPICSKKCYYCDFYSGKFSEELITQYISALSLEWALVSKEYNACDAVIDTVYIGGGTPSLLSANLWNILKTELFSRLNLSSSVEWSIECNPDSFTSEKAEMYAESGINRLTFGIQSLFDNELKLLGRIHTANQALKVLNDKSLDKFKSVGADLMYGIPEQTVESFSQSLDSLLNIPCLKHLSAYELTIEPRTQFGRRRDELVIPDEDAVIEMVGQLLYKTKNCGFNRYEVSNFSKQSFNCRHNEVYWEHKPYIGLGASAHSYVHPYRWSNLPNIKAYIKNIHENKRPIDEKEMLDNDTLAREMVFLGFRRRCGVNEEVFETRTGKNFIEWSGRKKLDSFLEKGIIEYQKPWFRLTEAGFLIADAVVRDLF